MHLFLSTKKSRYSIWRSELHERHKLLLKTGVDSFTGHPVWAWKHKSRQKHKNWNDCKFSWVVQSGTISFSKFTFHFNSSPTISLLARLHRYKSLIIQTYELNSKQKHKFLVTHLISTPHKLFHISRECILEVSTRLHEISQCPEEALHVATELAPILSHLFGAVSQSYWLVHTLLQQ